MRKAKMKYSVQYNRAFRSRVPASRNRVAFFVFSVIRFFAVAGFFFVAPSLLRAQSNPPFSNPSLDTNCYFPQIGVPGEIDTIVGDSANEGLGNFIHNLGPQQGGIPGNMMISGGDNIPFEVSTGSTFNLHSLRATAQHLKLDPQYIRFGHFHDRSHLDLFEDGYLVIYWADDNGNYDMARKTKLISNVKGSGGYGTQFNTYIAHLTSDTIDDMVIGIETTNSPISLDSAFLLLFRGGSVLANSDTVYEDTSVRYGGGTNVDLPVSMQGDFRGTGRGDLLMFDDSDNVFYYKNDPPFSLQSLRQAMLFDTIWPFAPEPAAFAMPVFPKKSGDNSVDLALVIPDSTHSSKSIYFFRGGPDFGSHRITIDSAEYVIHQPSIFQEAEWSCVADAGNMTGTGNHVLYTVAYVPGGVEYPEWDAFYVTGNALDDKIDIYNPSHSEFGGDTLTANDDSLEDFIHGETNFIQESNGIASYGGLCLYYGSKSIPVHLNPEFADVVNIPQVNGAGLTFAPNPVTQSWSVATIVWPEAEDAEYEVYNILGSVVQKATIRMLGGAEQQRIYFPNLPDGTYVFVVHGESHEAQTKLTIMR